jgi:hypothetical protein
LADTTTTVTVHLPDVTVTATSTPPVVTITTTTQLPAVVTTKTITNTVSTTGTSTNTIYTTATTTLRAVTTTTSVTTKSTTQTSTVTTTVSTTTTTSIQTNAAVCGTNLQIKNEADGYGVYYSTRFTAPGVTTLTACCQACYEYAGCQEYVFHYSSSGDTTGSCVIYYGGSQQDHSHVGISATCPSGVYQQANNPANTSPFGGYDYVVGLGQCAAFT